MHLSVSHSLTYFVLLFVVLALPTGPLLALALLFGRLVYLHAARRAAFAALAVSFGQAPTPRAMTSTGHLVILWLTVKLVMPHR